MRTPRDGDKPPGFLNGHSIDQSIHDSRTRAAVGFNGSIHWDNTKPMALKKQLDVSRLAAMGWRAQIGLSEGLPMAIAISLIDQLDHAGLSNLPPTYQARLENC